MPWPRCCGRATRRPRGGRGGSCGACWTSCAPPFAGRRIGCGWTGALPIRSCSSSSSSSRSSTSWRWRATRRLEKRARRLMGKARMQSKATGQTAHLYGETRYAARSWKRKRRVIIKAEVVRHPGRDPKNNPRFVVTNLPDAPEDGLPVLLRAGGRGEPAEGAASRAGAGPDQLPAVPGQPVPGAADPGGVRPVPGPAAPGGGHRLCRCAGHHAARAAAQARGVGRALGAADRVALAGDVPLAADVAADSPAPSAPRPDGVVSHPLSSRQGRTVGTDVVENRSVTSIQPRPVATRHCVGRLDASSRCRAPSARAYDPLGRSAQS